MGPVNPSSIVISPDGSTLYTTDSYYNYHTPQYHGAISIINTVNENVEGNIYMNSTPTRAVVSLNGSYLYTINNNNTISAINLQSKNITKSFTVSSSYPQAIAVSPNGKLLYVLVVYVVTRDQGYGPFSFVCEPYTSNNHGNAGNGVCFTQVLYEVNLTTYQYNNGLFLGNGSSLWYGVEGGALPSEFSGLAFAPDNQLYVFNFISSTISIVNTSNNSIENSIQIPASIYGSATNQGLAISPDGSYVYTISSVGQNLIYVPSKTQILVINTKSQSVVDTLNLNIGAASLLVENNFTYITDGSLHILNRYNNSVVGSQNLNGCPCEIVGAD